jgi:methyl-accepting chemotaxis protein
MSKGVSVTFWIRQFFGSIATKVALILTAMGATTAAAILLSTSVFNETSRNVEMLNAERLPKLQSSTTVLGQSHALKVGVLAILLADTNAEMQQQAEKTSVSLGAMNSIAGTLTSTESAGLIGQLSTIEADILALRTARSTEFEALAQLELRISALQSAANDITVRITQESKLSSSQLKISSAKTIKQVERTLNDLVVNDIALMKLVYSARAEMNFLAGLSLALTQTTDDEVIADFKARLEQGLARYKDLIANIQTFENTPLSPEELQTAVVQYENMLSMNAFMAVYQRPEIVVAQNETDALFVAAIKTLNDVVSQNSIGTADQNTDAIETLVDGPVANMSLLLQLGIELERFVARAVYASQSDNIEDADAHQKQLSRLGGKLRVLAAKVAKLNIPDAQETSDNVVNLVAFGNKKTGIITEIHHVIATRADAQTAADHARLSVEKINKASQTIGFSTINTIATDAKSLAAHTQGASGQLNGVAVFSGILFLGALSLTFIWILRPIHRLTATTRRLADGDLAEVVGFDRSTGEIRSMGLALAVFRNSLVENEQRQKDEIIRMEREQKEDAERIAQKQKAEAREAMLLRQAEDEKRAQAEAAENERAMLRKKDEARQRAITQEQEVIVSNLAEGLTRIAAGDLEAEITVEFSGKYDRLRIDFNAAVSRLRDVVQQIARSGTAINLSSGEISSSAEQLAERTQRTAVTLANTASSLDMMTEKVQTASSRADSALSVVKRAHDRTDQGKTVVVSTVDAMNDIEDFSNKIARITDVIDDIAFQTNLLALNAGVEAARAGSAGRGFAVVASEVRALAQRSSSAAKEINQLITESSEKVREGSELVVKTKDALDEIDVSVQKMAQEANEIAMSSREQAKSISEINASVAELDQVTQQNAAMFEETMVANQTMLAESENLSSVVAGFSIGDVTSVSNPNQKPEMKSAS